MNLEMEAELKAVIEKNLPAQVGDLLQKRLKEADFNIQRLKDANNDLDHKDALIKDLRRQIVNYEKLDERNTLLEAREKAVADEERNQAIATLQYQLAAEKDKTEFSKNVALGLVRNSEYRRTLHDNIGNNGQRDIHGNPIYTNITQNSSETKIIS